MKLSVQNLSRNSEEISDSGWEATCPDARDESKPGHNFHAITK
jgi:hypothetical protein